MNPAALVFAIVFSVEGCSHVVEEVAKQPDSFRVLRCESPQVLRRCVDGEHDLLTKRT